MDWVAAPPAELAAKACDRCKEKKRRCDKGLPSCSLCSRLVQACNYSERPGTPHEDEIRRLRSRVQNLEQIVANSSSESTLSPEQNFGPIALDSQQSPDFYTQAIFLDHEIAQRLKYSATTLDFAIPEYISKFLGDQNQMDDLVSTYLGSIHKWMPIISKLKLTRMRSAQPQLADQALLLLCMELLCHTPTSARADTSPIYVAAKQFLSNLQTAGLLSLRTLQAGLLISVYEIGHAIYPAAYVSVGTCARQGVALGAHCHSASQTPQNTLKWIDWEEKQRVWWLVLILDRFVTLGLDERPLCTEEPSAMSYIPADDTAWDNGDIRPPERVLASTPPNVKVSRFARLAQSANLLGRTIRHCNDGNHDIQFTATNFNLICGAIQSLLELILSESIGVEDYTSLGLCFSALTKIASHHSCDSFSEHPAGWSPESASLIRGTTQHALQTLQDTTARLIEFASALEKTASISMESISPLVLHCLYYCAITSAWLGSESANELYIKGLLSCKRILEAMDNRWKLAGAYLKLIQMVENDLMRSSMS
ncbi:hypothetical protein PDE_02338 [Penicillium oxalicum 114-2]|uniref:Zn(2)-C6 fungal-type domain-containing protein n=1 Tax=Penicillium oxalicum (strain 114-2 / CGMCC 5302) TaxID=933388 RepID=S7Z9Z6_PENO1|nr:hypothetical protein PDE_02338 [Penicillium oxalicum 114-2]